LSARGQHSQHGTRRTHYPRHRHEPESGRGLSSSVAKHLTDIGETQAEFGRGDADSYRRAHPDPTWSRESDTEGKRPTGRQHRVLSGLIRFGPQRRLPSPSVVMGDHGNKMKDQGGR
jgi:hypothetical protein